MGEAMHIWRQGIMRHLYIPLNSAVNLTALRKILSLEKEGELRVFI